jgi:hypothetical protein
LVKPEYEEPFSDEWKKSSLTKKDFLMEIANEFISDKGLEMEKIELPKVKRGRKTIHHTEEERKEAKRVTQKKYLENTRKKNPVLTEQDRERSKQWEKENICRIQTSPSLSHLSKIEEIIEPTGMKVSELFKKAVMEFLEENYKEEDDDSERRI